MVASGDLEPVTCWPEFAHLGRPGGVAVEPPSRSEQGGRRPSTPSFPNRRGENATDHVPHRDGTFARRRLRLRHRPVTVLRVAGRCARRPSGNGSDTRRGLAVHHHSANRTQRTGDDAGDHRDHASTHWAAHGIDGPVRPNVELTIEPLADNTRSRLTVVMDFEGHGIGRVLVPLVVRRQAASRAPQTYQHLKERLEGTS